MSLPNLAALRLADDDRGAATHVWVQYRAPDEPPALDEDGEDPLDLDPDHCCTISGDRLRDGQWVWKSGDGQGRVLYDPRQYWNWLVGRGEGKDPYSRARLDPAQIRELAAGPQPVDPADRPVQRLVLAEPPEVEDLIRRWHGGGAAAAAAAARPVRAFNPWLGGGDDPRPPPRARRAEPPTSVNAYDSTFNRDRPNTNDDARRAMVAARFGFRVDAEARAWAGRRQALAQELEHFVASMERQEQAGRALANEHVALAQDPHDLTTLMLGLDARGLRMWVQQQRVRMMYFEYQTGRDEIWQVVWGRPDREQRMRAPGLLLTVADGAIWLDRGVARLTEASNRSLNVRQPMPADLLGRDGPMHRLQSNEPPFDADTQTFDDVASLNPLGPYLWTQTDLPRALRTPREFDSVKARFKVTVSIPLGTRYDLRPENDPHARRRLVHGPKALVKIEVQDFQPLSVGVGQTGTARRQRNLLFGLREVVRQLQSRQNRRRPYLGLNVRAPNSELLEAVRGCEDPPNSGIFYFWHKGFGFPTDEPAGAAYDPGLGTTSVCDPPTYLMLVLKALFGAEDGVYGGVWWRGRMPTMWQGAGAPFYRTVADPSDPPEGFAGRPFTQERYPRGETALRTAFGTDLGALTPIPDRSHATGILRRELGLRTAVELHQDGPLSTTMAYGVGGARGFDLLSRAAMPPRPGLGAVDYDVSEDLDRLYGNDASHSANARLAIAEGRSPDTRGRYLSTFAEIAVVPRPSANWLVRWEAGAKRYHFFWRGILPDVCAVDPLTGRRAVRPSVTDPEAIPVPQRAPWLELADFPRVASLTEMIRVSPVAWLELVVDFELPHSVQHSDADGVCSDGVPIAQWTRRGAPMWHGPPIRVKLLARRHIELYSEEALGNPPEAEALSADSPHVHLINQLQSPPDEWVDSELSHPREWERRVPEGRFQLGGAPFSERLGGFELQLHGTRYHPYLNGSEPVIPPTLYMMHALERLFGTSDDNPNGPFTSAIAGMEYPAIDTEHRKNVTAPLLRGWERPMLMSYQTSAESFVHARTSDPTRTGATVHYGLATTLALRRSQE